MATWVQHVLSADGWETAPALASARPSSLAVPRPLLQRGTQVSTVKAEGDPIEDGPSNLEKPSDKKRDRSDLEEASPSHLQQHKEPSDGDSPDKTASHKGSHDELTTNDIIAVKRLKRGEESDSSNDEPVVAAAVRLF